MYFFVLPSFYRSGLFTQRNQESNFYWKALTMLYIFIDYYWDICLVIQIQLLSVVDKVLKLSIKKLLRQFIIDDCFNGQRWHYVCLLSSKRSRKIHIEIHTSHLIYIDRQKTWKPPRPLYFKFWTSLLYFLAFTNKKGLQMNFTPFALARCIKKTIFTVFHHHHHSVNELLRLKNFIKKNWNQ